MEDLCGAIVFLLFMITFASITYVSIKALSEKEENE